MEKIKRLNDTTYEATLLGGDKVEIGDIDSPDFKPHIKLNRWDGECFIKIGLPTESKFSPIIEGDKVKWVEPDREAHFYPLEPRTVIAKDKEGKDGQFTQNELGGFEFEIILKKKPAKNKIVLDIETQGLTFHYQPPLTPKEVAEGCVRPDNVVGSYAVYHATRTPFHKSKVDAEKYKCGKAFHVYRPKITDVNGDWVWGELSIDERVSTLTITMPQDFLNNAIYPMTVDPDFGETGVGGSWESIAIGPAADYSKRQGNAFEMPAPGGTANYIKAYVYGTDVVADCKVHINQKDSGGAGNHGQIAGPVENLSCAVAEHWEEFTLGGETLTATIVYILNINANNNDLGSGQAYKIAYDSDGAIAHCYESQTYCSEENPWVDPSTWTSDLSIYCNYDEAAVTHEGAATLAGVGTLTGIGRGIFIGKATLSGVGTLAAIGRGILVGVATLAGTGSLSAIAQRITYGIATLAGVGTLAISGVITAIGKATLSGVGTLAGIGRGIFVGKATLSGVGTLASIGSFLRFGKATLSGVGTLTGIGRGIFIGKSTLSGAGTLAAIGSFLRYGKASLSGTGTLAAIGQRICYGVSTLTGVGTLAGKAVLTMVARAVLAGVGTLLVRVILQPISNTGFRAMRQGESEREERKIFGQEGEYYTGGGWW